MSSAGASPLPADDRDEGGMDTEDALNAFLAEMAWGVFSTATGEWVPTAE